MDVEKSSLCNCVVNFLLEENYLLSAFELLHELLEDGRDAQAIRLKEFFSDPSLFPPDQISRFGSLRVADPQSLLEEKELVEEKLAISEYELRLAQEDLSRLKAELQKQVECQQNISSGSQVASSTSERPTQQQMRRKGSFSNLGPLKDAERRDLNCAIKEYLLFAGYRLTAITFLEEVTGQDLDIWYNTTACVPDALRHYYYEYLSSTAEAAEEKFAILQERESLMKANEKLNQEMESLLKSKELADGQIITLTKSLEAVQKELKEREILIQDLKKSLELQRKDLNDCRAEITSLKMHIEGSRASRTWSGENLNTVSCIESYKAEIKSLQMEIERLKLKNSSGGVSDDSIKHDDDDAHIEENVVEIHEDKIVTSDSTELVSGTQDTKDAGLQTSEDIVSIPKEDAQQLPVSSVNGNIPVENKDSVSTNDSEHQLDVNNRVTKADPLKEASAKLGLETIQILSDALPRIVPYVLINHREELIPLIMCAIERHPDGSTRDSLTHTLFNLIKKPDEKQRRVIMDACVCLAKNIGEMRTESELLPQCWEQINHMIEERRLLVALSCGELAGFVRPEIRDSLILSIVQQLIEDSATVVREAAAHNLTLLLPLFPNMDKYFKVEEIMFQLVCDPSGVVVETSLKELVPAVLSWGNKLDHVLRVVISHILGSVQRCPPLSGVAGSVDSHLHVLGEQERWNIEVLLRMLTGLLPFVHQKAVETCPFPSITSSNSQSWVFSTSLFEMYAGGHVEWPAFEWLHNDCFPYLIQLACLLPKKEDNLRTQIAKFLLAVSELFGQEYQAHIMLPVFSVAVGDDADMKLFPSSLRSRIKGLRPKTVLAEKLAIMCVLPLLLAGILGSPSRKEQLADYLRKLLLQNTVRDGSWSTYRAAEIIDAVRFLCAFRENHGIIFHMIWEMVVSSNINMKISAANLLKALVPYIDVNVASSHAMPALITLGSDQNLNVKYASVDAFGAVAQHFKNDMIVEKIRVQMDGFLEDGSHEAIIAVIRALVVAVPHTTDRLREYLLSKVFHLITTSMQGNDVMWRREKANAFCEAIRALDATEIPMINVRDLLIPAINNLLKDSDALDPAHKEALEVILRERSSGALESITKAIGIPSSVTNFFGESGLLGKKENPDSLESNTSPRSNPAQAPGEDTRFRRIMRGNFGDMLRTKTKAAEESPLKH